jgi:nitrogen regulatory protein PII 2
MVTIVVEDNAVDDVVETLISANKSGKPGDGKIFVIPVGDGVRIRTGEMGKESIA